MRRKYRAEDFEKEIESCMGPGMGPGMGLGPGGGPGPGMGPGRGPRLDTDDLDKVDRILPEYMEREGVEAEFIQNEVVDLTYMNSPQVEDLVHTAVKEGVKMKKISIKKTTAAGVTPCLPGDTKPGKPWCIYDFVEPGKPAKSQPEGFPLTFRDKGGALKGLNRFRSFKSMVNASHEGLSYPGNIGVHEMFMFYDAASPQQEKQMEKIMKNQDWGAFKKMIKDVINVELR